MTDSDSLRGDPNYDPTRRTHPEIRELDTLRALLRPRMAEAGDPTPTEALRGMFIEIEHLRDREGRRRPMDEAIIADNENTITRLTEQVALESKLARAAAEGHDHARATLVEIAKVFGCVNDLDSLPAMVRELGESSQHVNDRISQMDHRIADLASQRDRLQSERARLATAIGDAAKEIGVLCEGRSALEILPDLTRRTSERSEAKLLNKIRNVLDIPDGESTLVHVHAAGQAREQAIELRARVEELTDQIKEMGAALDETALNAKARRAALVSLGWDGEGDPEVWAKKWMVVSLGGGASVLVDSSRVACAPADPFRERWTKICEAFGFDPEQDPPVSIPAILAGDRWTNTRRMLADACANLRAPSFEVILGELVQTLSKARTTVQATRRDATCTACARRVHEGGTAVQGCSDCYWLEFGDAPPQAREEDAATAQARTARPSSARCPVCHRMAPVKHGGFQEHLSGDRVCAGTSTLNNDVRAALTALG